MKVAAAAVLLAGSALHMWVYRFAGRTGSLPGRGGWVDRRTNPKAFAVGRAVVAVVATCFLVAAGVVLVAG